MTITILPAAAVLLLLHLLGFAILTVTAYVIFDIEYPRLGLIRIDAFDQVLRDLRRSMK